MANPEHLQILEQGVEAWNAWRRENRDIRPDFSGAHLAEADLTGADLPRARLQEAGLRTWFAPEDLRWGQKLYEQLDHASRALAQDGAHHRGADGRLHPFKMGNQGVFCPKRRKGIVQHL